ncbi:hypothetical protein Tco_0701341 [Tanacetum coccineum]
MNEGFVKNTFASALKTVIPKPILVEETSPTIVIDYLCLMERDFSCSLMGKIKDINSNLYIILANEGFENVKLVGLCGSWTWQDYWHVNFPILSNVIVPHLNLYSSDELYWKDQNNVEFDFSVAAAWDSIRSRDDIINWFHLDLLKHWDIGSNTDLNLLRCPLCNLQPDSHDHLFFECIYSLQVWEHLKAYMHMPNIPSYLSLIVDFLIPLASKKSTRSIIVRLVFAAACYFIWHEQNSRLFSKQNITPNQLYVVMDSVCFGWCKGWLRFVSLVPGSERALGYVCNEECRMRVLVVALWHVTCVLEAVQALLEVNVVLQLHFIVLKLLL